MPPHNADQNRPIAAFLTFWAVVFISVPFYVLCSIGLVGFGFGFDPSPIDPVMMNSFPFFYVGEGTKYQSIYYFSESRAYLLTVLEWLVIAIVFSRVARHFSHRQMFFWAIVFFLLTTIATVVVLTVLKVDLIPTRIRM